MSTDKIERDVKKKKSAREERGSENVCDENRFGEPIKM
jgi:hypothetical protein